VLAAIDGLLVLLAEIGCVVALAGWVAGQVIGDLQEIRRIRSGRR
jgi:hypothetical protein